MSRKLSTRQKGYSACLKVKQWALEKGYIVSTPDEECRYDLVLDDGRRLYRVQVKWADGRPKNSTGAVIVGLRTTYGSRGRIKQFKYTEDDADVVMVYVPKIDAILWLDPPMFVGRNALTLRLDPPKNGQKKDVVYARDLMR